MRLRSCPLFLLAVALAACGDEPARTRLATDSVLREELLVRGRSDQAVRERWMEKLRRGVQLDSTDVVATLATDSSNTAWLKDAVREHGWPDRSRVGPDAADAAFLIVQHSPDTAFQREMLTFIRRAFVAGEVEGQHLALLTDRIEVAAGRPQLYGTQASVSADQVFLHPIADSERVDERRAELGMMSLADYVRLLDSAYTSRDSGS